MNMQVHSLSASSAGMDAVRAHVSANGGGIQELLEDLAEPEASRALRDLRLELDQGADAGTLALRLCHLRDALAGAGASEPASRPDFDAAVNWHGARIDELITSLSIR